MNKYCVVCNKGKVPCKLPKIQDDDEDDDNDGNVETSEASAIMEPRGTKLKKQQSNVNVEKKKIKSLKLLGTSLTR